MIVRSYNPIEGGPAVWIEGAVDARAVRTAQRGLRELSGETVDVVLDSEGGNCTQGMRLYNLFRAEPRRKRFTVLCARSMATVVMMAGDVIRMVDGATLFFHAAGYSPEGVGAVSALWGPHVTAEKLRDIAGRLDATDDLHLDIYERRTGLTRVELQKLNAESTTLQAKEALALGFVDEIIKLPEAA